MSYEDAASLPVNQHGCAVQMSFYGITADYKQGRAECGECGGVVVPVAGSARALGACPGLYYL